MTGGVKVICGPSVAAGFALAGLVPEEVADAAEAAARLATLSAREDVGVVLVEDALWTEVADEVRHQAERAARPVVVPFPSPGRPPGVPAHEHIIEILRRAIGYRVRL